MVDPSASKERSTLPLTTSFNPQEPLFAKGGMSFHSINSKNWGMPGMWTSNGLVGFTTKFNLL
jgi:hypothetical protein